MGRTEPVLGYLREQRESMVAFLERLVRAESPTERPEAQREVLAILRGRLEELGFRVRHLPGSRCAGHLYAVPESRAGGRPGQLLLGHCDTVWPQGTLEEMPLVVRDGVVRGPGTYDMKAGLTQMLYALQALRALDLRPEVTPVVLINSDEEAGSPESERLIRIVARRVCRAFVLEPSYGPEGKLKTARKGIGQFEITVTGRAAHAGLEPGEGSSAIVELAHLIQKLDALNDRERGISVNVGVIDGGLRPNVIAPMSRAIVDVRVPTRTDGARVEREILGLRPETAGVSVEVRGRIARAPMERTPRNRALWKTARGLGSALGLELDEAMTGGVSDGNTTSQFTATLDGLGAVGGGAHALHEHVEIDPMVERSALLALLLMAPPA